MRTLSSSPPELVRLLDQCKKDIEAAIKGLTYLVAQSNRIGIEFWPTLFKRNAKVALAFQQFVGSSSLYSDDLAELYLQLSHDRLNKDAPDLHHKDNGSVHAFCAQLDSYEAAITRFANENASLWEVHQNSLSIQIDSMVGYLKQALDWLRECSDEREAAANAHKKSTKLSKIVTPTSLELKEIKFLQANAKACEASFTKIEGQIQLELPHVFALLQEFMDYITSKITLQHTDTCHEFLKVIRAYAIDFGLRQTSPCDCYRDIIDTWESDLTGTRLQIESLVGVLRDKKPEMIDTEIQGNDESSRPRSAIKKLAEMSKNHEFTVNCSDPVNGLFSDHIVADPIVSFQQYFDSSAFRNDPFHVLPDHSYLLSPIQSRRPIGPLMSPTLPMRRRFAPPPPPMPVPIEFHHVNLSGPESTKTVHSVPPLFVSSPPSSICSQSIFESTTYTPNCDYTPASPIALPEHMYDSSARILTSPVELIPSELGNLSHRSSTAIERTSANSHLRKLYNLAKNDVGKTPVLPPLCDPHTQLSFPLLAASKNSISYDTMRIEELIARLLKEAGSEARETAHVHTNFIGLEPGDLSVKAGETVELITNLTSYHGQKSNWTLCRCKTPNGILRTGFVPISHIGFKNN